MTTYSGTNGDDTLTGTSDDDTINAKNGDDTVDGGEGDDTLLGGGGDDELTGGEGDDFIHGGTGTDTAVFSGSVTLYSWYRNGENLYITGLDGTDRLIHVEFLQFDDATIDADSNNAPIAIADFAALTEDDGGYSSGAASVLDNDFDWEGDSLSVSPGVFTGAYGTLTLHADGTYSYSLHPAAQTIAAGDIAQDSFTYTVSDGSASSTGTLTFNITGLNDAPVASPDSGSTGENSAVLIDVLANDSDVDDGAVLTVVAASAPAGQGTASVSGNQVQFDPGSDFDDLAVGQTEVVTVSYTIEDEHGASSSSTIEVTVTGANDGPVANADTAATGENSAVLIDVLANDSDVDDGAVLTVLAASAPAGQGTASVSGNQVQFDPGSDFDDLAVGQTEIVTVSYTIEDEHGASSSSTIEVTVTGANDGPVANADTASTGENSAVLIDVLANDSDVDDGAVLTVVAASAPAGQGTASVSGNQVQFDPGSDFDDLAVGQTEIVTVSYTIEDEHGASSSSTIEVTVTGANDGVTIDAGGTTATGTVTELPNNDPNENAFTHQAGGTIAYDDPDAADVHSATATADGAGYLGTFTLDPVDQSGDTVGWSFEVDDSAIDFLDAGESLVQTYTIEVSDGNGGTATQQVTVTINGADDNIPPDAVDDLYAATGNVTLTVPAASGLLANDSDDAGMGDDPGETPVTAYDSTSANGGTVTVNPDGSFSYTSAPGFSGTDSFTYTVTDAEGKTDTATVTVEVSGAVWFIDNAAAGSANLGTQADPYTSLAAFNAAQGTANGPAAGDTVYLREGTGTYAEADGINLLDGQTLIGGGKDLVIGGDTLETGTGRPTIVTTGGGNHGIELATNNTVKGLDVGDTTGAGISDGNGSVGSLVVADVGVSGLGQIADIDQGGTLNVTLNGASSSLATGGAIDLAGVGGSFTIAGAVTIAGADQGIGIAGSSVAFTLAGGAAISTILGTAISFAGNSGSFASTGGGLVIATAGGSGIVASGGGTITIEGTGNSVATGAGTAVTISGTTIGTAGVTLQSVATTGAVNGIVLADTGSGAFAITGDGTPGSGGSIVGSTGAGILLTNTGPVALTDLAIQNGSDDGIGGTGVDGLKLVRVDISGNGDAAGESGADLAELSGLVLIDDSTFSGNAANNLHIVNSAGRLDLTVTGSDFSDTNSAIGNDGIFIQGNGAAEILALISGNSFDNHRGDHFQYATDGSASSSADITFTGNTLTTTDPTNILGGGITMSPAGGSDLVFAVTDNTISGSRVTAINASGVSTTSSAEIHGTISGNTIGIAGVAGSASAFGDGIDVILNGHGTMTMLVEDNAIRGWGGSYGIFAIARVGSGQMNATIRDNDIDEAGAFALNAIRVQSGVLSSDTTQIWLELSGNDSDTALSQDIRVWTRGGGDMLLPGYGGAANDTVAVDAFLTAKNPDGGEIIAAYNSLAGSGYFDTPGSIAVPLPLAPDLPIVP